MKRLLMGGNTKMKFIIQKEVFQKLPEVCFGAVVAYGIDNSLSKPEIVKLLEEEVKALYENLKGKNIKEYELITPYREAFMILGINPNKYMSSIEAMAKRVANGSSLPSINGIVDLVNSVSLKYVLPMGAHDLDALEGNIFVRFAIEGDKFIPLGGEEVENVDPGELVYSDSKRIRTRRWIWRQSDCGKITESSKNIFFPIDGFEAANKQNILNAMQLLSSLLEKHYNCIVKMFFVDKNNNEIEL
jgi:DNA/RNA-binding domain of Phe-tRNA-synthetase-like protein